MTTLSGGRLLRISAAAGAVGALGLIEHRRLGPWTHAAYRLGYAATTGMIVADAARRDQPLLDPVRDGIVTGGVTLGMMGAFERVDAAIIEGMRGAGVRRARPLLAALGAVATVALYGMSSVEGQSHRWGSIDEIFDEPELADLPGEARALAAALLETPDDGPMLPGARTLRDQLATARSVDPGYLSSDMQIVVEQPERLAVPRNQTWPVTGEFTRAGIRFLVRLQISDGMLSLLSVTVPDGERRVQQALEHLASPGFVLPSPDELTLRVESDRPD
ncbi:hypothetical protein ACFQRD_02390 [Brachybacterium sp. GCM10030268]|uniref:hypothetical protein n=1 Tax=Brachybacterium sp. GCM10030268 TaxID=3273382 RepID=UPI00361225B4